jgi:hypothetical protein
MRSPQMTSQTNPRFYVEVLEDQFQIIEYDAFDNLADAMKLAQQLVRDGTKWADVVDRQECILIERVSK